MKYCEVCGEPLPESSRGNRRLCGECAYKAFRESKRRYERKRYAELRERLNAEAREEHDYWKNKGYCTKCHKERADHGFSTCTACREKAREYRRMKRLEKKKA